MLLTKDLDCLVIKNNIKGKAIIEESKHQVEIAVGGGENWHELVLWCLENDYGGLENLSLIPGTVGAAPIQNIGAYGVELKDVFHKLEAVHLETGKLHTFLHEDCQFAYRDSVFKTKLKGQFCITQVFLKLTTKNHAIRVDYGAIKNTLTAMNVTHPTIQEVSQAVIEIRSSKLPDPAKIGNSGSFFKNPEIPREQLEKLQEKFPNIVFYDLANGQVKVPAGWLIEQDGWKGKRIGNTGAHAKQALVLVNYGEATGKEIETLAYRIIDSVEQKFGIRLSPEVNIL